MQYTKAITITMMMYGNKPLLVAVVAAVSSFNANVVEGDGHTNTNTRFSFQCQFVKSSSITDQTFCMPSPSMNMKLV